MVVSEIWLTKLEFVEYVLRTARIRQTQLSYLVFVDVSATWRPQCRLDDALLVKQMAIRQVRLPTATAPQWYSCTVSPCGWTNKALTAQNIVLLCATGNAAPVEQLAPG